MARQFSELPRSGRFFLSAVISSGAGTIVYSLVSLVRDPVGWDWLILVGLIVLTGSFSIKVPSVNARLSVSEAFVFAGVLSFGLHVGTIIVALDSLILTSWLRGPSRSPMRAMFNMTAGALAISCAGWIFESMLAIRPAAAAPLDQLLLPVLVLALSYFVINSWLIATAVAYEKKVSAANIWRANFSWLGLNYLGGASVALVLVSYTRDFNLAAFGVVVPLLVVLYVTFRTSWGRVEDANRHVAQLNELYLSTIETLAMAVDAKDQITHGHIRRVQVFAVELARRVGVTEERQIKAIEAAALLHDMGKLGIPEHILNKPGRLTPTEFERMKQHAALGADLLSSVRFPYPVVPIVRHHHENWDGSGYPAGIAGTDIPFGARILSVVDCFDALTSDRPYRPRLSTEESFNILKERRGTMYDPLVVDTFIRSYSDIAPIAARAGAEATTVFASDLSQGLETSAAVSFHHIRANASEAALLSECRQNIAKAQSLDDAFKSACQVLRQMMPATIFAFYSYDSASDSLICNAATGDPQGLLTGLTIRVGQRVTGWAAANRRTSVNSDASLDLAQIAQLFQPALRSTISTPVVTDDSLVAALTAYSFRENAFSDNHLYSFEQVSSAMGDAAQVLSASSRARVVSFNSKV